MSFLAPWAAWFLAGVPIIILLYVLKLKRRPVTVSTLIFWERVLQESRRRALFQRLRNLLSLLLHLLIFLLIVGALAKPVFDRLIRAGSSTVLILDTRARMQALEPGGSTRFKLAKRLAGTYARRASADQQMALLTLGAAPDVAVPFTGDEKALDEALEKIPVTDSTGDLAAAVQLAEDLLASRKGGRRIIVLTDRAAEQPERVGVEYVSVGSGQENVAITRFATRPLLNSPGTSEILLEVRNFGNATARGNVELAYDGRLIDVKPFTLEPGGRLLQSFPWVARPSRSARGWLTARLDATDALPLDDIAYAVLPPPMPKRVLLITKGNWFLEKMLAADQSLQFELLAPENFGADVAAKFDAVVLDNVLPEGVTLAGMRGNVLFLRETPFATGETIEQPLISSSDAAHPTLRFVDLQNVTIVRAAAAALPADAGDWQLQSPLTGMEHPLMITGERRTPEGRQRLAALSFDVAESDLPLRVAFPLLISNTVQWLAGGSADAALSARAGETLQLPGGENLHSEPFTNPAAALPELPPASVSGFFQPLRNGFYRVQDAEKTSWLAVNTFSEAESDLRTSGAAPAEKAPSFPALSFAAAGAWPLWQYLALAALLLFGLEWRLFHRRRTE